MNPDTFVEFKVYRTESTLDRIENRVGTLPQWHLNDSGSELPNFLIDPVILVIGVAEGSPSSLPAKQICYLGTLTGAKYWVERMTEYFRKGELKTPLAKSVPALRKYLLQIVSAPSKASLIINKYNEFGYLTLPFGNDVDILGLDDETYKKAINIFSDCIGKTIALYSDLDCSYVSINVTDNETLECLLSYCMMLSTEPETGETFRPSSITSYFHHEALNGFAAKLAHLPTFWTARTMSDFLQLNNHGLAL